MLQKAVILFALLIPTHPALAIEVGLYRELLERYTIEVNDTAGTRVDYEGLQRSADWARLIASLDRSRPEELRTRQEKLAYWINVYNILTIDLVRRNYPVSSIRDLGSFLRPVWQRQAGRVGGRSYTLDEIEREILRGFGEPRIHGAIVCASVSCPSLRREPYEAASLDLQLDDSVRRWLADPRKGARLDPSSGTVHLSRIFEWFMKDFAEGGGARAFVRRYAQPEVASWLRESGEDGPIRYLDYDWSLNSAV